MIFNKPEAMFSKLSQLYHCNWLSAKGAMFGLDARIALAIFGALSVISGAALYSAIQSSKATAFLVNMQEVGKALEQYYLDTGEFPADFDANGYTLQTLSLVRNPGVTGWQGPYLPYPNVGDEDASTLLDHPLYDFISILIVRNDNVWGGSNGWGVTGECVSGQKCSYWVEFVGVKDAVSLAKSIDNIVDDGDGNSSGNFRWADYDATFKYRLYLKIMPAKNPND